MLGQRLGVREQALEIGEELGDLARRQAGLELIALILLAVAVVMVVLPYVMTALAGGQRAHVATTT